MCRNIKTLFNYEPPASQAEINAAALQFVRKISGFQKPSKINEQAFQTAIKNISKTTQELLESLETSAAKHNREEEAQKARLRNQKRFS